MLKLVTKLALASGLGQVINLCGVVLISQYYLPEQFSIFSAFLTASTIFSVVISIKLDYFLLSQKNEDGINKLARQFLAIVPVVSLIFVLIFSFLMATGLTQRISILIIYSLDDPLLLSLALLSASGMAVYLFFTQYFIIKAQFRIVNLFRVMLPVANITLCLFFGYWKVGEGLMYAYSISQVLCGFVLFKLSGLKPEINAQTFASALCLVRNTRLYILSGILNNISIFLPVLVISKVIGVKEAGFYVMAQRLLSSPSFVLGNAFAEPLKARLPFLQQSNSSLFPDLINVLRVMLLITFVPLLILQAHIANILRFSLGESWSAAGQVCEILLPMYYLRFLMMPCSVAFLAYKKPKVELMMQFSFVFLATFGFFVYRYISLSHYYSIVFSSLYLLVCVFGVRLSLQKLGD